jgi:hypothetical protein
MKQMKQFSLVVTKVDWPSPRQIMAVQVPWDQFCTAGVPDEYAALIAKEGGEAVLVSRAPDGTWASASAIESLWKAVCAKTPVEAHLWNTMKVESDHYPWELAADRT